MLTKLSELPNGITGVAASGKVTRSDYEDVLNPIVEAAHRDQRRIRFLYQLGQNFEGFSPGAALEDFRLGRKYQRLFERVAIVTDKEWIRAACHLMAPIVRCPTHVFSNAEISSAIEWLNTPVHASHLEARLIPEKEILLVEVKGPLSWEDFDQLASQIDPWIESHHTLRGLVVHAKHFPGWENLGSFFRHLEFVGEHHRKIQHLAVVADGILPGVMTKMADYFVSAKIKHFGYSSLDDAVNWAAQGGSSSAAAATSTFT